MKYVKELETSIGPGVDPFLKETGEKLGKGLSKKNKELVDLMYNLLSFNPYFRMTAREVITLQVFDEVRDVNKEKFLTSLYELKDKSRV